MRLTTLLALILLLLPAWAGAATAKEFASAMNVAGRQRMLSQKMLKELLLIRFGIDAEANRKACATTARMFADSHKRLVQGDKDQGIPAAPTPEVAAALAAIDGPWGEFQAQLTAAAAGTGADPAALAPLAAANEPLLATVASMVQVYEAAALAATGTASGKVVNWAGRQRMLSQKMAKEALLIAAGIDADGYRTKVAATRALFGTSHQALSAGDAAAGIPAPADPIVQKQMAKVGELWVGYQAILDRVAAGDVAARLQLAEASIGILTETNKATSLFESRAQ